MDFSKIPGFAEEKVKIEYTGFWDWLVAYKSVGELWRAQPSFIYLQVLVLIGSFVTLFHAVKNGGRFLQLWIGVLLHGIVVETISYNLPDIDNFWQSQTPIMFLGRRLPLYIILIYIVFLYSSSVAVDKLSLPRWSEPFAVGLVTILIDYPYDIVGIRFMHWTWHDTDPNIFDRHYYVPWNSFYFHSTFAASFTFWFHSTRQFISKHNEKWKTDGSFLKELTCTVIAALLGMPGGVLLFIPIYHPLHDIYKIHSEVTFFFLFVIFASIVWFGLPKSIQTCTKNTNVTSNRLMLLYLCCYYLLFVGVVTFVNPEDEVSIGLREPIGPCNEKVSMKTALGHTVYKRKYLCLTDNDETYYGWSCLPNKQPPKDGAHWYTVCGTPFTNRIEYIVILTAIAIFGISFFFKTLGPHCFSKNVGENYKVSLKEKKKM